MRVVLARTPAASDRPSRLCRLSASSPNWSTELEHRAGAPSWCTELEHRTSVCHGLNPVAYHSFLLRNAQKISQTGAHSRRGILSNVESPTSGYDFCVSAIFLSSVNFVWRISNAHSSNAHSSNAHSSNAHSSNAHSFFSLCLGSTARFAVQN